MHAQFISLSAVTFCPQSIQSRNHLAGRNQHNDNLGSKNASSKVSRIIRDKEHVLGNGSSRIAHAGEDATTRPSELVPEPVLPKEENNSNATERETDDLVGSAPRSTTRKPRLQKSSVRGKTGDQIASTLGKSKSRMSFSRLSDGGATTAIAMVVIGAIMLLLGPLVIILRILDERKQARKLVALSAAAREDLPPTYEQVVFMSEAPRYSTLSLNDDYSSPPPSAATSLIKSN
jgi:hypothetical protein